MIVTMMRMMEVATTTLIITIVGSEEGTTISVTFLTVVSFIVVLEFSVDVVVVSFIIITFGIGELAVIEVLVISSVVTGVVTTICCGDLSDEVVGSVDIGCGGGVVGGVVMMVSGGQVEPLA